MQFQTQWNKLQGWMRFLPDSLVRGVCTCGPVGYWGKAPGTNGTVVGLALYTAVFFPLSLPAEILLMAILISGALLFCNEGEKRLKKRDPGEIILDEIIAVPLCFIGLKGQMMESGWVWLYMLAGFGLFRLYDIAKPFGISGLQRFPGGIGVVVDDLAAAVAVNLTIRAFVLAYAFGGW